MALPFDIDVAIQIILFLMGLLVVIGILFAIVASADVQTLVAMGVGLLVGSVAGLVISGALALVGMRFHLILGLLIVVALSTVSMYALVQKRKDFFPQFSTEVEKEALFEEENKKNLLLDETVLYDARILNLLRTGFFERKLELTTATIQAVYAMVNNSEDANVQARGKRTLRTITELKSQFAALLVLTDEVADNPALPLPDQLMSITKRRGITLLTCDFAIATNAKKQKIPVLNILDLIPALQTVIFTDERIKVYLTEQGSIPGEVVGNLSDGTKVVVRDAGFLLGKEAFVKVTNVLETVAGRVVQALPDEVV